MELVNFKTNIEKYLKEIESNIALEIYTEHTHRPALKSLIDSICPGTNTVNEPRRIECGAPDYIVLKGRVPLGYIESKDIGENLDSSQNSDQLNRYRKSLPNLILTDFLEFRWYVKGELKLSVKLANISQKKVKAVPVEVEKFEMLLGEFLESKVPTVKDSKDLAIRMAELSKLFMSSIIETYRNEGEEGKLHDQLKAIQEILIPDITLKQFADMYAQTVSYGMFVARCAKPNATSFSRTDAVYCLPKTYPFLRKLFGEIAGPDLDERIAWVVDEIAELLSRSDLSQILRDFGKLSGKNDPIVHFYETFLATYSPEIRQKRGVFYTPTPVVSYIVRSIDHLLKTSFERTNGISDSDILVLDPACGTGTFLYSIIDMVHSSFVGQEGVWDTYVSEKLLSRIFGFELLMAPYAIAHLKLGLQLQQLGYKFEKDERLGVYLTNSLEEGKKKSETLFAKWISEEANTATEIKREKPIMVVLGNPPYLKISANWGDWIVSLLEDYRKVDGKPLKEKKLWIQDDYVKFIRFGQWRIEKTGSGILAFITNHGYLDNPTFRGMRQSLMNTFDDIYILNLHGNAHKKETTPEGEKDDNVFDIMQGVSISIFVKSGKSKESKIRYFDLWGARASKYEYLERENVSTVAWQEIHPDGPYYFFIPKDFTLKKEYDAGWEIPAIFSEHGAGFITARDKFVMDIDRNALIERMKTFFDSRYSSDEIKERFSIRDYRRFIIKDIKDNRLFNSINVQKCLYRPFDMRYIYYEQYIVQEWQYKTMKNMLSENLGLLVHRPQSPTLEFSFVFCTDTIAEQCVAGNKSIGAGISYLYPLYIYEKSNRKVNLNPDFVKDVGKRLKLKFIEDGKGDLASTFSPIDIFHYIYAILHAPTYRERYSEFLKIDYPRIPLTEDIDLFRNLVEGGKKLVNLHLLKDQSLDRFITRFPISGSNIVECGYPKFDNSSKCLYINEDQYFEGVPTEVWSFVVGGYQVCSKWLKEPQSRKLTSDDIFTFQKIVVALKATIETMNEIDALITKWPLSTRGRFNSQANLKG